LAVSRTVRRGTPKLTATRFSRHLCQTPDEADARDEYANGQQHCANMGEIDEPFGAVASGDTTDRKNAAGTGITRVGNVKNNAPSLTEPIAAVV
jgi:hypothetical protein